jgi:hypothetical protein
MMGVLATAVPAGAFTTYIDPPAVNSVLLSEFTTPPPAAYFNSQLQGSSGGTTIYESNGVAADPQITFNGGAIDLTEFPHVRARFAGSSPDSVNLWRNPAQAGQALTFTSTTALAEYRGTIPNANSTTTGYRIDPVQNGTGWTFELDSIYADRGSTWGFEFGHVGDDLGLTFNLSKLASLSFGDGSVTGVAETGDAAASDTQISFGPALRPNPDVHKWLEIRMAGQAGDRIDLFFSNLATPGIETRTIVPSADGNLHTYLVDLSDEAGWSGTLDFLRIDPTTSSGASFEIDSIRFYESAVIPEPSSLGLVLLAPLGLLRRRRR